MSATIASAKPGNNIPSVDGEINLYESPEGKLHKWWDRTNLIIFVNGMANSGEDHRESALALSLLQNCKVVGVFNATKGGLRDFGQCVVDKAFTWPTKGAIKGRENDEAIVKFIADCVKLGPSTAITTGLKKFTLADRVRVMREMLRFNDATVALFDVLMSDDQKLPIYAHSQGNLITCNALRALVAIGEDSRVTGRKIFSYGSPTSFWPSGIIHQNYAFMFDPITYLSVGDTNWFTGGNITAQHESYVAHGFLEYMKYDAEFLINRFRVRNKFSLSQDPITLSMDEKGLAGGLLDLKENFERILAVMQRLYDKHNADADDVASHYVRKLKRNEHGMEIAEKMKLQKPELVRLLIKCLDEGWTTDSEYKCIDFLKESKVPAEDDEMYLRVIKKVHGPNYKGRMYFD